MNLKILFFTLFVFCLCFAFSQQPFILPKNGQTQETKTVYFSWNPNSYSTGYKLQIAKDSSFNNRVATILTANNFYTYVFPGFGTYYCRFKGNNETFWSSQVRIELMDLNNDENLSSWFDASNNVTSVDSTGGNVSEWTDRKLTTRTATQDNFFAQPILIDSVPRLNNKSVISFNGNSALPSYLSFSPSVNLTNYSLFMVRNYKDNSNIIQYYLGGNSCGFFSEADVVSVGFGVTSPTNYIASSPFNLDTLYSIYTTTNTTIYKNNLSIPSVVSANVTPPAQSKYHWYKN